MINTFTVLDKAQCSEFHVVRLSRTYPGTYLLNVANVILERQFRCKPRASAFSYLGWKYYYMFRLE